MRVDGADNVWIRSAAWMLLLTIVGGVRADDWPKWRGPKGDGVWRETGILKEFPAGGPKVLWRVPIGPGYCGPCVADGKLYVMDRVPDPAVAELFKNPPKEKPAKPRFPDGLPGKERIACIDTATGKTLWRHEYERPYKISYPEGPRATPTIVDGKLYTLGAMGDMLCLDAATGKVNWSKNIGTAYQTKPPAWGWSSHPLIDGNILYCLVGGKGSALVAFDRHTGAEIWKSLTFEEVGYSPPTIIEAGGARQLIVWMDATVAAVDPANGKLLWQQLHPADGTPSRPIVNIIAPTRVGDLLFISEFYKGSLALKLDAKSPKASVAWRSNGEEPMRPADINAIMTTPLVKDGFLYGICGHGELRCIEAATGKMVWESLKPVGGRRALFAHAFIVPNGDNEFLFNDRGELIVAALTPKGYHEKCRAKLLEPTFHTRGRDVVWCHPAFAEKSAFIRNDRELIRVWLGAEAN